MSVQSFADKVKEWNPILSLLTVVVAAVAIVVTVQGSIGSRLDRIDARLDAMQTESNRRFDTMQAENNRRHEELLKALQVFEGRISRIEGRLDSE